MGKGTPPVVSPFEEAAAGDPLELEKGTACACVRLQDMALSLLAVWPVNPVGSKRAWQRDPNSSARDLLGMLFSKL